MENSDVLKSALKSSIKATDIASKIKNIKGKIRMPIRNVTFVQPLNDVNKNPNVDPVVSRVEPILNRLNATPKNQTGSFASVVQHNVVKKVVQVKELRNNVNVDGAAVAIPLDAVEEVSSRFVNTLYGYFIGHRLAFPLVENYVKNTWAKFGLKRIQLHEEFFLFQFDTKEGMESVMEHGPWLIRRMPLMLNVWTPNTDLKKEEVKYAPLWVKLHHVPIVAYSEVGLSLISTQLGKPIMMDSYTSNMCLSSWGRSTYARILIEVSAEKELLESLVIAIPLSNGKGHTFATVEVEYEWHPPRCDKCLIYDHDSENCPKNPRVKVVVNENNDGFTKVKRKKNKQKQNVKPRHIDGVRLNKPPVNFYYRKVEKGEMSKSNGDSVPAATISKEQQNDDSGQLGRKEKAVDDPKSVYTCSSNTMALKNSFSMLDDNETDWEGDEAKINVINESDNDENIEELIMEQPNAKISSSTGASTPDIGVSND
ncbi:zinc knuckle CX2CX4HX4C containing protein [Tanacetum coccineum]